jgi:hypothetical protein
MVFPHSSVHSFICYCNLRHFDADMLPAQWFARTDRRFRSLVSKKPKAGPQHSRSGSLPYEAVTNPNSRTQDVPWKPVVVYMTAKGLRAFHT